MDLLFKESLIYTSIPLRRNVSARISLRGLRKLVLVDTLRRDHNVICLVERLIYFFIISQIQPIADGSAADFWKHTANGEII